MATLKDRLTAAYGRRAELDKKVAAEAAARAKPEEAIKQADAEIEALLAEQATVERENLIAELKQKCDGMEALIVKTTAVLTKEFAEQWISFCKDCSKLRGRLGLRAIDLPDHLLIKYYQALFYPLFPKYVQTKPHSAYLNKTFLQLFREYKQKFAGTEAEISRLPAQGFVGLSSDNDNGADSAPIN